MKIGYSDGATSNNKKGEGTGGYAWVIIENDKLLYKGHGSLKNTTNNECELTAIINLCNFLNNIIDIMEPVIIYSDSSYIINCYNQNWWHKWIMNGWINSSKKPVVNKELWEQLIPYFKDSRFSFQKVKGHDSNKTEMAYWNNFVDKLAVQAKFSFL